MEMYEAVQKRKICAPKIKVLKQVYTVFCRCIYFAPPTSGAIIQ